MLSSQGFASNHRQELFLIIAAFTLYLVASWWGLPYASNPSTIHGWDVDGISGIQPLAEFNNLLFQPSSDWYVAYPLFHYIVLGVLYAPYLAYLWLIGGLASPSGSYPYGLADPITTLEVLAMIGRLATVAMGCGVVINVYQATKTTWDRTTGCCAALLVMLITPIVYYARTGNLDIPVFFWISCCLVLFARSLSTGLTDRRSIWLGAFCALAVATKDQAFGPLAFGLAFLAARHLKDRSATGRRKLIPLGWLVVSGTVVFAVASGLLISPQRFLLHLHYVLNSQETFFHITRPDGQVLYGLGGNLYRPGTLTGYASLLSDIAQVTLDSTGPMVLFLGLVGLLASWRANPFTQLLAFMSAGYVLLAIAPVHHMQFRYAIPLAVLLAILAARPLAEGWNRQDWLRPITIGAGLIAFVWLLLRDADVTYQMLFDARIKAAACLAQFVQPGDQIGYFGALDQLPALPTGVVPAQLPADVSAISILEQQKIRFVLVSPDAWSDAGMDRSWLLDEKVYAELQEGSLGYQQLALFSTSSFLGGALKYLPIVNPPVQIFGSPGDSFSNQIQCE